MFKYIELIKSLCIRFVDEIVFDNTRTLINENENENSIELDFMKNFEFLKDFIFSPYTFNSFFFNYYKKYKKRRKVKIYSCFR